MAGFGNRLGEVGARKGNERRVDRLPGCDEEGSEALLGEFATLKAGKPGIEYATIEGHQRGFPRFRGQQCE
jgi:hypothetical protein